MVAYNYIVEPYTLLVRLQKILIQSSVTVLSVCTVKSLVSVQDDSVDVGLEPWAPTLQS